MPGKKFEPSAAAAALIGLLALASAMGIGRFSLTPILPLMQQDAGLTLTVGGWLATANYLGYLIGALFCIALTPRPAPAIRWGLVSVGLFTLAMGFSNWQPLWLALRFLAGAASAFVLVGTSAWTVPILARHGREQWSGHVFSGVGIGIALAGLFGLVAGIDAWSSRPGSRSASSRWRLPRLSGGRWPSTLRPPRRPYHKAVRCCLALRLSPRSATPPSATATLFPRPSFRRWRAVTSMTPRCSA
jgi:MFS family permease